jgi:hypothetical protein
MPRLTIFKDGYDVSSPHYISLETALSRIRDGRSQKTCEIIRNLIFQGADEKKIAKLKMSLPSVLFHGIFDKEIEKEFGSPEEFKELWDRYRKLKHNFHIIDIVTEPAKLFAEIQKQPGPNKVLWTTNIWPTMMLHWNVDIDQIEEMYLKFESLVPDDLVLYGQDYLANDLQDRIRYNKSETHPRFVTVWKDL